MTRHLTSPSPLHRLPGFDPQAPLLVIEDLHVHFDAKDHTVRAVNGVSLALEPGQTLGLLGESGCGKSVTARAVLGLIRPPRGRITHGTVRMHGVDLGQLSSAQLRRTRGPVAAMVFQDALSALNPVFTVGNQIAEAFRVHAGASRAEARERAVQMLERVGIRDAARRAHDYPHQFSGGMRQRAMIAMAVALNPRLLIADEPTTALDVSIQARIMRLLADLQHEQHMALLLISHDIALLSGEVDEIDVMYAGRIVERGPATEVCTRPAHPYTRALLDSMPRSGSGSQRLVAIPGAPPDPAHQDTGCAFAPRCPQAFARCRVERPELLSIDAGHSSACHLSQRDPP
ncbi:MAG: ABC transporter ATP-binding protein [Jatrophihabitans sp.]